MAVEVMIAVQSGTLLCALRMLLKSRVPARGRGGYNEVSFAIKSPDMSYVFET
jgi:hypothetical protein